MTHIHHHPTGAFFLVLLCCAIGTTLLWWLAHHACRPRLVFKRLTERDTEPPTRRDGGREPEYAVLVTVPVGPALVEVAERLSFRSGEGENRAPRGVTAKVIRCELVRDIETRAEAIALAAVVREFAERLP